MPFREDIPGYMPLQDLEIIETLSAWVKPNGIVVEIGAYFGRSSWAFAKSVDPTVKVYCIDPWVGSLRQQDSLRDFDPSIEDFKEYLKDCPNAIPIQGYSPEIPWPSNLFPDLVFVDGNHLYPYVDNDLKFWSKKLDPAGILCGHDFNPEAFPDVCEAVINISKELLKPFRVFKGSSIWYIEKGRIEYSKENRERLSKYLLLETISWQPGSAEIQNIRKIYQ